MMKQLILLFLSSALAVGHPQHDGSDHIAGSPYNYYWFSEKVTVKLYYESLCPDCIAEYPHFVSLVEKLGANINLATYPYGNARMHTENNKIVVQCQHGEKECYGNKLHACAMDRLNHVTTVYVKLVACLMQNHSEEAAVEPCLKLQNLPMAYKSLITECANGARGQELLIYYGTLSQQVSYPGVPYVLINGKPKPDERDLMTAVCEAFKNPPDACNAITDS